MVEVPQLSQNNLNNQNFPQEVPLEENGEEQGHSLSLGLLIGIISYYFLVFWVACAFPPSWLHYLISITAQSHSQAPSAAWLTRQLSQG